MTGTLSVLNSIKSLLIPLEIAAMKYRVVFKRDYMH